MALSIPIISEFQDKGIKRAIAEFKQLETTGKKAQFALKKAALPAIAALGAVAVMAKGTLAAGEAAATSNARIAQINESMGLFGATTETLTNALLLMQTRQRAPQVLTKTKSNWRKQNY
jgi:hypothetical protein